jgi:hypothetical protein
MSIPRDWDVYRDADGNPVTITEEQVHAIWHAIRVVEDVRRTEGSEPIGPGWEVNLYKSRLLGRMLIEGKPPLPGPASELPHAMGAVAYWEVEPDADTPRDAEP